ncbi:hypothetical protein [Mycolicibacterium phlei]|jgi:hypothetical protein|uniref:hypothetical protein n=1 Tax=Mycolicibacterium phlei TaxID=1771 RepID=UPI00025AED6F|nr:hypothetical protein [Mycolicibacterium phlei]EID17284.1 hypothetical protein MPHLEI_04168 [Mycolicibacterium phlei RIVM601174]MBF4191220.1 hypothetical protein [Mycolicibacterium phlei]
MSYLDEPFIGSEALERGLVRKYDLRTRFTALYPDVYIPNSLQPSLRQRATAAWLWTHRLGIIAGLTASALHGAKWVDDDAPIELIWPNSRTPPGLRTFDMRLRPGESFRTATFRMTTPARTAFDLGRRKPLGEAVARLDALGNATGLSAADIHAVARQHPGKRGLRLLERALDLYDPGAASPKETWVRLLVIRAGYPPPQTQIPVVSPDGRRKYYLDMGWPELMVALEYDGEHHRLDPVQYRYDVIRSEDLVALGWSRVRAVRGNSAADILDRLAHAWRSRLRTDREIS